MRLLGSRDEIADFLERYGDRPLPQSDDWELADRLHPRLSDDPAVYSPLTFGQLRRLGLGSAGVTLIFGSAATGLDRVVETLQVVSRIHGSAPFELNELAPLAGGKTLRRLVHERLPRVEKRLLLVTSLPASARQLSDFAKDAFDTLGQLDLAPGQWVRLVVLVGAEKLPVWFGLPDGDRLQWESQGGAAVLYRWSVDALRRRLEEMDLPSAGEISAEEIAKATGGYSILIESLFSVGTAKPDIKLAARLKTLASHLADPASETATAFRSALGMDTWELARPLYQTLASLLSEDEYADEDQLAALASEELGRAAPEIRSALLALERLGILDRRAGQLALEPLARRVLAPAADNQ